MAMVLLGAILSANEDHDLGNRKKWAQQVGEPSGLTYHPSKKCLVVVGDEGQIAEISLEGEVIYLKNLGGDLEAVTADPDRKVLYAIDETSQKLLVLDWETYEILDSLGLGAIADEAGISPGGKDSFEGLVYESSKGTEPTRLWLGHQRDPVVMIPLDLEGNPLRVTPSSAIPVNLPEISDLALDPSEGDLWVVCDQEDACFRVSRNGEILEKRSIRGKNQEGMVILPNGQWWIADDSGGIFRESSPPD